MMSDEFKDFFEAKFNTQNILTKQAIDEAMQKYAVELNKIKLEMTEIKAEMMNIREEVQNTKLTVKRNEEKVEKLTEASEKQAKSIENLENEIAEMREHFIWQERRLENEIDFSNDTQQHQRGFAIRIFGLSVPSELQGDKFLKYLYDNLFKVILTYAKDQGDIQEIPEWQSVLEWGHVLPTSRGSPNPPPIIVRFVTRRFLSLVLKYKFPALCPSKARSLKLRVPESYRLPPDQETFFSRIFVNGDMTNRNVKKLRDLRETRGIQRAWLSSTGKIKYLTDRPRAKPQTLYSLFEKPDFR